MDRSFLSQLEVIAAKKFVCIRLTSYEDEAEKKFVSKLVNGEPANTAFAMLTPDGERALRGRGPGRGPRDLYTDAADMAKGMDEMAAKYPAKKVEGTPALPVTLTGRPASGTTWRSRSTTSTRARRTPPPPCTSTASWLAR